EYIEISQAHRLQPIERSEEFAIDLGREFRESVRGERIARHCLDLRESRRIAVDRRTGRVDYPPRSGPACSHKNLESSRAVRLMRSERSADQTRTRSERGLMQYETNARRCLFQSLIVKQIAFDEFDSIDHRREILPPPGTEIIQHPHCVT